MAETSVLAKYPEYEVVIGIEVHVQLMTKSKIFCSCSNGPAPLPNTNICQICSGQPGVLPVLNRTVADYAIMAALATHSQINPINQFARKHYFYPDLPKGFQTTQSDIPFCEHGYVTITREDGSKKDVRLMRIHIEEDAGKSIHSGSTDESFVDLNRAGTPLLEIVTHPDLASAFEAKAYLKALRAIVMYLNICSGNMEEGAFRADTNISVRKKGDPKLGTRCELKNINSFKFIGDAIEHEIERQILLLESGEKVRQETRLWDTKERKSIPMRSKEEAADYRYFIEPDLPPLKVDADWIARIKNALPELPEQKFERLSAQGLSAYEAEILINDIELAHYYEKAYTFTTSKQLINWILRDLISYVHESKTTLQDAIITPQKLAGLVELIENGTINNRAAREVFEAMAQTGADAARIVEEKGLKQIGSSDELELLIKGIVDANPGQVADYKAGKNKLWSFFIGQAMAKTQGRANPQLLNDLLKKYLA